MPKKTKAERKKIDVADDTKESEDALAERSYYYDDAHGYKDFDPEKDIDDEDFDD